MVRKEKAMKKVILILAMLLTGCYEVEQGSFVDDPVEVERVDYSTVKFIQTELDRQGSGAVINLDGGKTYLFDSSLDLKRYNNVTINGNGATFKRVDSDVIKTELDEDYNGQKTIKLTRIPGSFNVGDVIAIADGDSVANVTTGALKIQKIEGNYITVNGASSNKYNKGDAVFKSFPLIKGLPSTQQGNANHNTTIENINFDGNARNNAINHGWMINGTIFLHGGKSSIIRNNTFYDIPNETIVGHGVEVVDNYFEGLNGSAFHTSVHDNTKDINGYSVFNRNVVIDTHRSPVGYSGHSEGAITFSWGGGNLVVSNNYIESYTGKYGFLGVFNGSANHTKENLKVFNNDVVNYKYIILIVSPEETPTRNISITNNYFDSLGYNDFSFLDDDTIKFGCNNLINTTIIGNTSC